MSACACLWSMYPCILVYVIRLGLYSCVELLVFHSGLMALFSPELDVKFLAKIMDKLHREFIHFGTSTTTRTCMDHLLVLVVVVQV